MAAGAAIGALAGGAAGKGVGEVANPKPGDKPGERDLRCVRAAADHAFAKEGAAERQAVEAADQIFAVPTFDRMGVAEPMEFAEHPGDPAIDPGIGSVRGSLRAQGDDLIERLVCRHPKAVAGQCLAE